MNDTRHDADDSEKDALILAMIETKDGRQPLKDIFDHQKW